MSPSPRPSTARSTTRPTARGRRRPAPRSGEEQHRTWLSLVEITGPFLSLPVLREVWPDLDPVDRPTRERLRREHAAWLQPTVPGAQADAAWITYVLRDLLDWREDLLQPEPDASTDPCPLAALALAVSEQTELLVPSFALRCPETGAPRLLGSVCPAGQSPTGRIPDRTWSATPVDRLARLCRRHEVPLGLVTNGRFWTLLYAPVGRTGVTVTFDAVSWPETAERLVLRAFLSLLGRHRFFAVPEEQTLPPLFARSEHQGEDLTEALGGQVRQAVELLVAAIGRADLRERRAGRPGAGDVDAHEVYRGAVAVMMRIVFLLFAEERHLLPSDNALYARAYSAGRLRAELDDRIDQGSCEEELEHSTGAWHRLRALFTAVHTGIDHPRLHLPAHAGSLFDPALYSWLPDGIDDRTVLHMLHAVQRVRVGTGRLAETRTVSFRSLDVEQIGYVYEGLLSFEGFRADQVVVGLIGKAGQEAEVPLADLEALAAGRPDVASLAAALATRFKDTGLGSARSLERLLRPLSGADRAEAVRKLLAVTGGDLSLAERLLPFHQVIRTDLRDLPVVILPGALYVTDSGYRSSTGTHYTPQDLAREVVEHALAPLVFSPGPLATADERAWKPVPSAAILELKVADIALGSGAFLVAAARYLADRLVEAWVREGDPRAAGYLAPTGEQPRDVDADPVVVEARRQVIEHCLYGVDINPMAVEMAKLSLWLVSMDARRSFAFLDDRLVAGDSLLGLTSVDQLRTLHLEPLRGRMLNGDTLDDWAAGLDPLLAEVAGLRRAIASAPDDTQAPGGTQAPDAAEVPDGIEAAPVTGGADAPGAPGGSPTKSLLLAEARARTATLELAADLVVGAALFGGYRWTGDDADAARKEITDRDGRTLSDGRFGRAAQLVHDLLTRPRSGPGTADGRGPAGRGERPGSDPAEARASDGPGGGEDSAGPRTVRDEWLAVDNPTGADRVPLHWPLVFPEVTAHGGFDAVIGNPPFLGGKKVSGSVGSAYREHLVQGIGRGKRGNADLIAYFVLRAHELLSSAGQTGLIATNTLAQGDTREVGLDQVVADGITIRRAVKSRPWPSRSATLEYCAVWTSRPTPAEQATFVADGAVVRGITSGLVPATRATGTPQRLAANAGLGFQGSNVLGLGFTMDPETAQDLLARDPRNREVLFPYLNGKDLNTRFDFSASRFIVNFSDRSLSEAMKYSDPLWWVRERVKPQRDLLPDYKSRVRDKWWQYEHQAKPLYAAVSGLERVLVLARHSKTVMPVLVPTGQVYSEANVVFATQDPAMLAVLSSAPHYWWARSRGSSLETRLRYTPTDVFETFPLPTLTEDLRSAGDRLDTVRREIMLRRQCGLTALYNQVFDPGTDDLDAAALRELHREIDTAAVRAHGWDDLVDQGLDHGFHPVGRELRWTVGPAVSTEILDRLLEENQKRHAAQARAEGSAPASRRRGRRQARTLTGDPDEGQLF